MYRDINLSAFLANTHFRNGEDKMAIFGKSNKSAVTSSGATIISSDTKIRGAIQGECKVHVDGEILGPIHSKSIISVGKNGFIEGDVAAKKLIVFGRFSGNADCEEIRILTGGKVVGQITCKTLVIERGSFFQGQNKLKGSPIGITDRPPGESLLSATNNTLNNVTRISEASKMVKTG